MSTPSNRFVSLKHRWAAVNVKSPLATPDWLDAPSMTYPSFWYRFSVSDRLGSILICDGFVGNLAPSLQRRRVPSQSQMMALLTYSDSHVRMNGTLITWSNPSLVVGC